MKTIARKDINAVLSPAGAPGWVPLAALAVGAPWLLWSSFALLEAGGPQSVAFDVAAGWFALLGLVYLGLHGLKGGALFAVPVLLTIEALLGFAGIPVWRFANGADQVDPGYAHAMLLALIGFIAFWIGSLVIRKEAGLRFVLRVRDTPARVIFISGAMLGLGVVGNFALWKAGLLGYGADAGLRASSLGFIQWLQFMANLLQVAVVVSAIEVIGRRSAEWRIKIVFWLSLLLSIGFGFLTGMKTGPLYPLLYVVLIYGIVRRRIPRAVILLPVFLVVLIYPFVTAYRDNLNAGYRAQVNTVGGLEAVLVKSFNDAFLTYGSRSADAEATNYASATDRVNYLTYLRNISELPAPSMLEGDEKVWLAPVYPLVPRFLWKGKPVLNKGQRLTSLLGGGNESSAALTPIGDLYSMYGTYGIVVGMLVWGVFLQLYMNWISRKSTSEKSFFVYISMLPILLNLESGVVGIVAGTVQVGIGVLLTAYVIYGRSVTMLPVVDIRSR